MKNPLNKKIKLIFKKSILFWFTVLTFAALTVGLFITPLILTHYAQDQTLPKICYFSIIPFFLLFWLINKKTNGK